MKQLTGEQIDHIVEGFISALKQDQYLTLQETENALLAYDVSLTLEQAQVISCFVADLIQKIDLDSWDYEKARHDLRNLGGDLYSGFVYDSYDTPLHDVRLDYSASVHSWIDDDDQTLARIEGYFCIDGTMYHL